MGNLFVSEYRGPSNIEGVLSLPPAAVQTIPISSAASTISLGAATNIIEVSGDAGALLLVGSSGSTDAPTSTNAVRIPANSEPEIFAVSPNAKLIAVST